MKQLFVAEVKTKSPHGFNSFWSYEELLDVAIKNGDALSIHTDHRWGGSMDRIKEARKLTHKPILAKGFHPTDKLITQALDYGATWVLVVGRVPHISLQPFCWIEPTSLEQIKEIPRASNLVWNSRDLYSNGGYKPDTWEDVRREWQGWICQASNIHTPKDVEKDADAFIVGTSLVNFKNLWQK